VGILLVEEMKWKTMGLELIKRKTMDELCGKPLHGVYEGENAG